MRSAAYGATGAQDGKPAIVLDEHLCEFDNGIFRGLTWTEAQHQYPELCQQLENSWDWIPIPEAESLEAGRSRARAFLSAAIADLLQQSTQQSTQHATDATGDATGDRGAWIVTHHWILQHLIAEIIGSCRTWQLEIPHTAAFEFWLIGSFWQPSDDLRFISHDPRQLNHVFWKIRAFNQVFVEIR
jgi:2,3-bisphosphoglycerate-dependent phosphoglycerate mutase